MSVTKIHVTPFGSSKRRDARHYAVGKKASICISKEITDFVDAYWKHFNRTAQIKLIHVSNPFVPIGSTRVYFYILYFRSTVHSVPFVSELVQYTLAT